MPPLSVKDLTMPAAAFTMAVVLTGHVYSSIGQARQEADMKRARIVQEEQEKKTAARLRAINRGAPVSSQAGPEEK
ncbi:hypothetical protein L198_04362 [Cryptococcus wingfieldii CBS 7118]|uniref:Uncharacterized protein n=1 Tax=Cryptococcus wingfieldii CBS 7118 TaxID=1295528 RepID=A0A1E3J4G9_9TREE|nr:hypothetical protein L198_04362 [Cryptococcus wingfieldii CBS 7118]ODN95744.1 hypothetical protein L198_04362 [Cryptococcus wingfieldii CBS 7118]